MSIKGEWNKFRDDATGEGTLFDDTFGGDTAFGDTFGSGTVFNDAQEYLTNITTGLPRNILSGDGLSESFKKWGDDIISPETDTGKAIRTIGILTAAYFTGGAALSALGGQAATGAAITTMAAAPTATAAVAAAPSAAALATAATGLSASAKAGLILTAASTVASGVMSHNATKRAETMQREGTSSAIAAQRESDDRYDAQLQQRRTDLNPYVQAGYDALGQSPSQYDRPAQADSNSYIETGEMPTQQGGDFQGGTQPTNLPRGGKGPTAQGTDPAFAQNGAPISYNGEATRYDQSGMPIANQGPNQGGATNLQTFGQIGGTSIPQMQNYAEGGMNAYNMQQAIAGTLGPEAQADAISMIEASPQMAAMVNQGENAILSNASATGGLRGGNTQAAMAQFRPQMLSKMIDQKYGQLGGMANTGFNASNTMMNTSQNTLSNIANMGMTAAGGTPIGQSGASPTASYLQQSGRDDAAYSLQNNNNMVNTLNSGVDNYFKYRQMNDRNKTAPAQSSYDYSSSPNYGPSPYAEQRTNF